MGGQVPAEEFTVSSFLPKTSNQQGADFVALQLIMDFDRPGDKSCESPILNSEVTRIDTSFVCQATFTAALNSRTRESTSDDAAEIPSDES